MMDKLYPLFEWFEFSLVGETVRASLWLFPVIEAFHLVAFAVLGGAILLVDLRLLGLLFRADPVAELAANVKPWRRWSLVVMIVSGALLFMSEAVKCFYSYPFRIKMVALLFAILFSLLVRDRIANGDPATINPWLARGVALLSLVAWGTVAWAGRWIGFSG